MLPGPQTSPSLIAARLTEITDTGNSRNKLLTTILAWAHVQALGPSRTEHRRSLHQPIRIHKCTQMCTRH
ncbi:hypothetical protein CGRA01v4_13841 [Colletotrichum graminicola]|nr:hypothetical protein CGRA01v4_13841 [Colletotrichum graminicola]